MKQERILTVTFLKDLREGLMLRLLLVLNCAGAPRLEEIFQTKSDVVVDGTNATNILIILWAVQSGKDVMVVQNLSKIC